MLTTGSSRSQPVCITAKAAITTPSEIAASAAVQEGAPDIDVALAPERNISAVAGIDDADRRHPDHRHLGDRSPRMSCRRWTASHTIMPTERPAAAGIGQRRQDGRVSGRRCGARSAGASPATAAPRASNRPSTSLEVVAGVGQQGQQSW